MNDERALSRQIAEARQELRAQWTPDEGGRAWGQRHAQLLDDALRRLFTLAAQRSGGAPPGVALVAVGGYGSRVLAPCSDLDLILLVDRDDDPPILRETFRLVMDVLLSGAKIKVGYAYRHLSDLTGDAIDHQSQTALLDARLRAGDGSLFARFDRLVAQNLQIADFLFEKEAERIRVRARAGETPYLVEPDLKEGAGGLRDVQTALWMAQARLDKKGESLWRELERRKILTRDELRLLQDAREHLYRLRHLLHLLASERRDRFTIPLQEEAAHRLGQPSAEALMRLHYRAAAQVARLSEKIVQRILDAPIALGGGLSAVRRQITLSEPDEVHADPLWPMRALALCQRYRLELSSPAAEALAEHRSGERWSALPSEQIGARFLELLDAPGDVPATLRRMERTGLLADILPELDACMTLVPYDPTHIATVGEHSLRVLENLARARTEGPPAYHEAMERVESRATLYLAALLHDIGKQWPTDRSGERAPHEITGAEAIPEIGARLGAPERMVLRVQRLVRWHLLLAEVSRLRDLTRPETIREVTEKMDDPGLLNKLYVLTWADTSAVAPGVWTEMKAQLLDELYGRAAAALEAPDEPAGEAGRLDSLRDRLRRRLTHPGEKGEEGADPDAVQAHIQAMPSAYLFGTPSEAMTRHLAMLAALESSGEPIAELRTLPGLSGTELTLVARDDPEPGLLAKVTGVLYAYDVHLHAAQVFTRPDPNGDVVIDTLVVDFHGRPLERHLRAEVSAALTRVLSGAQSVEELLARRRRPTPTLAAIRSLTLDAETEGEQAILDITTAPDDSAMHCLASTLSRLGWNIHAARLTTWAGGLRCALYLSHLRGGAGDEAACRELFTALRDPAKIPA